MPWQCGAMVAFEVFLKRVSEQFYTADRGQTFSYSSVRSLTDSFLGTATSSGVFVVE